MADAVKGIVTDIQAMLDALSGITHAPAPGSYPDALNAAQLPVALTWPGEAEWAEQAIDLARQDVTIRVEVYAGAVAEGRGIGSQMRTIVDLLQDVGEAFVTEKGVTSPLGGYAEQIMAIRDSGMVTLPYAGKDYRGFVFELDVVEKEAGDWFDPYDWGLCTWAAYQPKNAASLAASYTDLSGNGNDAAVGVAPTWDATNGWIFNGTTQYLTTAFVPQNDQTQSMLVQCSSTGNGFAIGSYDAVDRIFALQRTVGTLVGFNGSSSSIGAYTDGNLAIGGDRGYINGVAGGTAFGAWAGAAVSAVWIGCVNFGGVPLLYFPGNIQAIAIYDCTLTAPQVAAIAARMAAL